jgi:hypothetical protein
LKKNLGQEKTKQKKSFVVVLLHMRKCEEDDGKSHLPAWTPTGYCHFLVTGSANSRQHNVRFALPFESNFFCYQEIIKKTPIKVFCECEHNQKNFKTNKLGKRV